MEKRKFLIDTDKWAYQGVPVKIILGYLSKDDKKNIIIRTSSIGCFLTINSYEYKIPKKEAHDMLELCNDNLIKKIKYKYKFEGRLWEIDVFKDANEGLIVAKFDYDDTYFEKPDWVLDEITYQSHYSDNNLAEHPYSEW